MRPGNVAVTCKHRNITKMGSILTFISYGYSHILGRHSSSACFYPSSLKSLPLPGSPPNRALQHPNANEARPKRRAYALYRLPSAPLIPLVVSLAVVVVVAVVGDEFVVCNVDCECAQGNAESRE